MNLTEPWTTGELITSVTSCETHYNKYLDYLFCVDTTFPTFISLCRLHLFANLHRYTLQGCYVCLISTTIIILITTIKFLERFFLTHFSKFMVRTEPKTRDYLNDFLELVLLLYKEGETTQRPHVCSPSTLTIVSWLDCPMILTGLILLSRSGCDLLCSRYRYSTIYNYPIKCKTTQKLRSFIFLLG